MTAEAKDERGRSDTPQYIVLDWWEELQANRGARASLRRAHSLSEVAFVPAYHNLRLRLSKTRWSDADGIALVAGVVAHVKKHDGRNRIARQLSMPKEGKEAAPFSDKRFRRLIQNKARTEAYNPMVRAVRQLDGNVNVIDLANDLYWWNERTRRDWAFDYYGGRTPQE